VTSLMLPSRQSQATWVETNSQQRQISLAEMWAVICKRKLVVTLFLGLSMASALVYCIIAPRRYEATARLMINPDISSPMVNGVGGMNAPTDPSVIQETEVRVMQSDAVAWEVIRQQRLDRNPEFAATKKGETPEPIDTISSIHRFDLLTNFHKRLNVASIPKTALVEIRFCSKDPKLAADVVNAIANVYIERNFRVRYNASIQDSDWLSKQLVDLKAKAESSQQQLSDFEKKNSIIDIGEAEANGAHGSTGGAHSIIISQLEEQNQQLVNAQAERIAREARYREALDGDPAVIAETAPTAIMQALQTQQADLKNQYAQLSDQYGNAYPRVVQIRTQLSQVEASLQTEAMTVQRRLESEFQSASRAEKIASDEVEKSKRAAYKMNEAGIQDLILRRDLGASRDLYEDLLKKLKEAGVVAGLKSTNVNVVDAATIPVIPAEPRVLLDLLVAFMLGATGAVGAAFLLENLDTTIGSPDNAEMLANLPVLGVVPHFRLEGRNGTKLLIGAGRKIPLSMACPQSAFTESFRALRTTLLQSAEGNPPKVLLITSAVPGEGKTTMAINLAIALAQYGRRVLLVDADMRRGSLQKRLGLEGMPGLSQYLTETDDDEPVDCEPVVATDPGMSDLSVMPSGQRVDSPAELLGSDTMRHLAQKWRRQYDHIVIDTPPVLALTDAAVLAQIADGVLLVARAGRTRLQTLSRTRDLLARDHAHPIGVVLTDFDNHSPAFFAHYGYHGRAYDKYYGQKVLNQ
jgi:succinoglycan biosynthesis transport protein ExoP